MPANKAVINTSPLILLFNSELSFILPELFDEVVIPEAVWNEILVPNSSDKAVQMLPDAVWIKRVCVKPLENIIQWDLGYGETEVLSFAFANRDYKPVLDDMTAKKCALSLGIHTLGTGTVLILAKQKGLITSVEHAVIKLRNSGMWISDAVIKILKQNAGE